MNQIHLLSLLQEGFTTVHVQFPSEMTHPQVRDANNGLQRRSRALSQLAGEEECSGKAYTYKARLEDKLQVGDYVVVDTPREGFKIVRVVGVDPSPVIDVNSPFEYKWVVQKIDTTTYDAIQANEQNFKNALVEIERVKAREQLLHDFDTKLPPGSDARKMFEEARASMKTIGHG